MTLEQKLKAKSFIVESGIEEAEMVLLSDALSICKSEIAEACKKQREICLKNVELISELNENDSVVVYVNRLSILNAPSPKESE